MYFCIFASSVKLTASLTFAELKINAFLFIYLFIYVSRQTIFTVVRLFQLIFLLTYIFFLQCNHSCPKLHNPFTGEEMDFIELLKSFGLDMESVANALGIDMETLNNMDHGELLNLLTQQSN